MNNRAKRTGFTLIELLIVVGIISVLIVVLAIAVLPWLGKSDENATRAVLQQIGTSFSDQKVIPTLQKFKKDAGSLSGKIAADEETYSSQMILFYVAPERSVWDASALYKGTNYAPAQPPESFKEFTREDSGKLAYLVDAWDMKIWCEYDKNLSKTGLAIFSRGEDKLKGGPDDLVFDPRDGNVKKREDMTK